MALNINADEYTTTRMGIYFPGFPSSLTGQCVSLIKWYLGEMCGVADWQAARGNAKDFGDTLVRQGIASVVPAGSRKRGDIVVWKDDGGGYGHIGVLLTNDRIFEENVGLIGAPSAVYDGNTVHPSRIDSLYASWRKGLPTFYRVSTYIENIPVEVAPAVVAALPPPVVTSAPVEVHVPEAPVAPVVVVPPVVVPPTIQDVIPNVVAPNVVAPNVVAPVAPPVVSTVSVTAGPVVPAAPKVGLQAYNKFFIALAGAILATVVQYYGNDPQVATAIAFLSVLGVHIVPNKGN